MEARDPSPGKEKASWRSPSALTSNAVLSTVPSWNCMGPLVTVRSGLSARCGFAEVATDAKNVTLLISLQRGRKARSFGRASRMDGLTKENVDQPA